MSSLRRILASRANGATPRARSLSRASCVLLKMRPATGCCPATSLWRDESPEGFEAVLKEHLDVSSPPMAWDSAWSRSWSLPTGVSAVPGHRNPDARK